MTDSEIKDTFIILCELTKTHVEQLTELQRKTTALIACLPKESQGLYALKHDWPDTEKAQKLEQSAASQLQSLERLIQRLKA